jgi:septation ring formation regulator EzrA
MSDMNDLQGLQRDLKAFLSAIQDNRNEVAIKLKELDTKLDTIPLQLEGLRKEQRDATDQMRREFSTALDSQRRELQSYFVAKSEFNPYQQTIYAKIAEYDNILSESRKNMPTYYNMLKDVETLKEDVDHLTKRGGENLSRSISIVAVLISVTMLLLNLFQHVSIHP